MAKDQEGSVCDACCHTGGNMKAGASGGIYGLAFIGAAIYFIQHATTFWMGALGVLKALFWPAVLIYKVLERLGI